MKLDVVNFFESVEKYKDKSDEKDKIIVMKIIKMREMIISLIK